VVKQRANLILLVLLLALFVGWWGLTFVHTHNTNKDAGTSHSTSVSINEPVIIYASTHSGDTDFSGALAAAACLELGTGVLVQGTHEPHVTLQFSATPKPCPAHATSTDNSFLVSVQGNATLDQVLVNNAAVGYKVEKSQQ
jgi:hypothetical protein